MELGYFFVKRNIGCRGFRLYNGICLRKSSTYLQEIFVLGNRYSTSSEYKKIKNQLQIFKVTEGIWNCTNDFEKSGCNAIFGDLIIVKKEECDDDNDNAFDGCYYYKLQCYDHCIKCNQEFVKNVMKQMVGIQQVLIVNLYVEMELLLRDKNNMMILILTLSIYAQCVNKNIGIIVYIAKMEIALNEKLVLIFQMICKCQQCKVGYVLANNECELICEDGYFVDTGDINLRYQFQLLQLQLQQSKRLFQFLIKVFVKNLKLEQDIIEKDNEENRR